MSNYLELIPNELQALIISYIEDYEDLENFALVFDISNTAWQIASSIIYPNSYYIWNEILNRFPEFDWKDVIFLRLNILEVEDLDEFIYDTNQEHQISPEKDIFIEIMPDPDNDFFYRGYKRKLLNLEKVLYLKIAFSSGAYQEVIKDPNQIEKIYNPAFELLEIPELEIIDEPF